MQLKWVLFRHNEKADMGRYIAARRKSLKTSQRDLAQLCGVSEHALCNLERAIGNSTFDLIENVADALGLEVCLKPKP